MKRTTIKVVSTALSSVLALSTMVGLAACGPTDELAAEADTTITFWGYGDNNEQGVFQSLVQQFNELNRGDIYVNYEVQASDGYGDRVNAALGRSRATVDVLYIPDESIKSYATEGYLAPLDEYIESSDEIQLDDMWTSAVERYRYDVNTTTTDGPDAHYYGMPKDIGPTVIFYNEDHFTAAGVKVISVAKEDLEEFNAGDLKDDRGRTKTEAGLPSDFEVKPMGYFEDSTGQKWFNNQVPMSWDECRELATLVQETQRDLHNVPEGETGGYYGYFTEWWFNYGWSVGGDCIEYVPTDDPAYNGGYWEFTIMEDTPNYIVADDAEPFTINGNTYQPGEILSWNDKLADVTATDKAIDSEVLAACEAGQLNELPSQRDAFVEFVRVGQDAGKVVDVQDGEKLMGYGICPAPSTIQGDSGKALYFKNGYLSMLVDGRWNVVDFRKDLCEIPGQVKDGGFAWDVAPLPIYKEYYEEEDVIPEGKEVGDIKVHGVEAGHSGSVALSINNRSQKKDAAWKFVEFIAGATGQTAQAQSGFAIPSQKSLAAQEDVFLQTDKCPQNSEIFLRAAEVETPGDWWYLKDKLWINPWAGVLNSDVRNGLKTLTEFQNSTQFTSTNASLREYTKK